MIQSEMSEWENSRMPIPGLTLEDREFARLVAITVIVMWSWELDTLGGRPIRWKRLPMTVTVRPEWRLLVERYYPTQGNYDIRGMTPLHDLCIVEARKIMRISGGNIYA